MLKALGRLLLFLVLGVALIIGFAFFQTFQGRRYVSRAVTAIYTNWDVYELQSRAAADLRNSADFKNYVPEMFRRLSVTLGPLQSADDPTGEAGYRYGNQTPHGAYGRYFVHARFRNGEADLDFLLVKERGVWCIAAFHIESPVLANRMQTS